MNVQLLKDTFELAKPIAIDIVSKMYENLFNSHPEAKGLFENVNFDTQKQVLANSIAFIVENVEDGERLTTYLQKMGARHINYGTEPEHYDWVGEALLGALEFYMGDDWTDEVKDTWTAAFGFIATTMQDGALMAMQEGDKKESGSPKNVVEMPRVQNVAANIDFELSDEVKASIEGYARSIFENKIKAEFESCFEKLASEYTSEKIKELLKSA